MKIPFLKTVKDLREADVSKETKQAFEHHPEDSFVIAEIFSQQLLVFKRDFVESIYKESTDDQKFITEMNYVASAQVIMDDAGAIFRKEFTGRSDAEFLDWLNQEGRVTLLKNGHLRALMNHFC